MRIASNDTGVANGGSREGAFIMAPIVECIAEDRLPTRSELVAVARRIWSAGAAHRPLVAWDRLPRTSPDRLMALRAAQLALCGAPEQSF